MIIIIMCARGSRKKQKSKEKKMNYYSLHNSDIKTEVDDNAIVITLINPWSKAGVNYDVTDITDRDMGGWMLDEDNYPIGSYNTPGEWLAAYVDIVGSEVAGNQILGC